MTERIPDYLTPFIAKQDPSLYTPIDHASWRYILRLSRHFFKEHAHQKYLDGLQQTGISTERIPLIEEMDEKLRRFGWRAVAVVGFIPPAVFLEFQSLGVLVIACDMRRIEHLGYTPAPDIVHEAAGHAPIIADEEYRNYLRSYGEVAQNAIFSKKDLDMYEAIRDLSDVKEDPRSTPDQIRASQARLDAVSASVGEVSEASQLSRMAWWTTEYGLVGDMSNPLIYGAGLLSSISESFHCLDPQVKKLPLSARCVEQGYDITKPQPQLYVAPNFAALRVVLEEFADTMAFRRGGVEGLMKAKRAETATTTVLDSGLQISSTLTEFIQDPQGSPVYLQYKGPTQLAYAGHEIEGHGTQYHAQGFGTPIGLVRDAEGKIRPAHLLKEKDLHSLGFVRDGKASAIEFTSGVRVEGVLTGILSREGKTLLLTFSACTVTLGTRILFQPEWGIFDMACGEKAVSVFGGAADRSAYLRSTGGFKQRPASQKTNRTPGTAALEELYVKVRKLRESNQARERAADLAEIQRQLDAAYPEDWLLRFELLELDHTARLSAPWAGKVRESLQDLSRRQPENRELIVRGLDLLR